MKIVIDTNLLVSAFVFGGIVKKNLKEIFAEQRSTIITSSAINAELKDVLFREKFRKFQARTYLEAEFAAFLANAVTIPITRVFIACRDPKDNKFLDAAVSGRADCIIPATPIC